MNRVEKAITWFFGFLLFLIFFSDRLFQCNDISCLAYESNLIMFLGLIWFVPLFCFKDDVKKDKDENN